MHTNLPAAADTDEIATAAERALAYAERVAREATTPSWHLTDPPRLTATTPYCPPSHCYCGAR